MILRSGDVRTCPNGKPRASGDDPDSEVAERPSMGVNPARAGMIPRRYGGRPVASSKPRASGDDPDGKVSADAMGT